MKKQLVTLAISIAMTGGAIAQSGLQPKIQNYRAPGQDGLNVFEDPKEDTVKYEGLKVRIGGDFALQFQGLDHSTGSNVDTLVELGTNFNLPTANLNLDVQLHDGVRMHLRTFLSSRHHSESWVKGGHIQFDKLNFIEEDFLSGVMEIVTVKIGLDEINYGDAHFRRTDNARAIYNPFVGNYIMDAYTTEAFGEIYVRKNGFIGMLALSNGKLNQNVTKVDREDYQPSFYGKLGYDSQMNEDLRLRLTGSWYINQGEARKYLYDGDRAGSRYYHVMEVEGLRSFDFSGRFNPNFRQLTAFQINPFVKWKGLEFFGVYEMAIGGDNDHDNNGSFSQYGAELLYRIGKAEKLYVGGRYNLVTGKQDEDMDDNVDIQRFNVGAGWFLTKNIIAKAEYVQQNYNGDAWGAQYNDGEFSGFMFEAAISF
jgi:hypothetical protein